MNKLDLSAKNVDLCEIKVEEVRRFLDEVNNDDLAEALNLAQNYFFNGDVDEAFVVIKITK